MATQLDDRSEQDSPAVACFAHFVIKGSPFLGKALIINACTPYSYMHKTFVLRTTNKALKNDRLANWARNALA